MVWFLLSLSLLRVLYLQPDPLFIACFSWWSSLQRTKIHAWPPSSQVIGRRIYGTLRHCWNETPGDNLDDSADLLILHFGFNLFSWECQNGSLLMGRSAEIQKPPVSQTIHLPFVWYGRDHSSYAIFWCIKNSKGSETPSLQPWFPCCWWAVLKLIIDRVLSKRFGLIKHIMK